MSEKQVESVPYVPFSSKQGMFVIATVDILYITAARINLRVMLYSSTEDAGGPPAAYAQQPGAYAQQPAAYAQQPVVYTQQVSI